MVADVTVVTQQQTARICGLATGLAHCALQATPAFTEHHLSDLSMEESHIQIYSHVWKKCFGLEFGFIGMREKERVTMNCYLNANTKWMVALATLSAGQETALRTEAKTPTHHTHVLGKNTSSVSPSGLSCDIEGTSFLS